MKTVLTSDILAGVRKQRFPKSSLLHLQESAEETIQAFLAALQVDPAIVTILEGVTFNSSTPDNYQCTAGLVAYGGQIHQVDAQELDTTDPNVAVWQLNTSFRDTDPVKFSDGNEFNVNQITKMVMVEGVSGSGLTNVNESAGIEKTIIKEFTWDMETSASIDVDFSGVGHWYELLSVDVFIVKSGIRTLLPYINDSGVMQAWHRHDGSNLHFKLNRLTGGLFDSATYNDVSGYIVARIRQNGGIWQE